MDWVVLILSGCFEAIWAVALSTISGPRRIRALIVFILASIASIVGLGWAMRTIPTGTAYAIWTAIGASLTVIYGMATGAEKTSRERVGIIMLLIACVVGLKVVA